MLMRELAHRQLERMRLPNGLYIASLSPFYRYVWIRDTCYIALAFLNREDGRFEQTYHAVFDIFHKYRWKLEYHSKHRPKAEFEYVHPRYSATEFEELTQPWGNAQNDAVGAFLYGVGEGLRRGKKMFRGEADREIVELLVKYLVVLEYWQDIDNGMWEETRELHASSIGACVAGLLSVRPYVSVEWEWIRKGLTALAEMLPRESASKACDLALLSLIYPYQLLPPLIARELMGQVEHNLLRERGVIRYAGDRYYGEDGREAEWCFGLAWLGLCHGILGDLEEARGYLRRTEQVMSTPGVVPELYLPVSQTPNENTPLAWAQAMYLQLDELVAGEPLSRNQEFSGMFPGT